MYLSRTSSGSPATLMVVIIMIAQITSSTCAQAHARMGEEGMCICILCVRIAVGARNGACAAFSVLIVPFHLRCHQNYC